MATISIEICAFNVAIAVVCRPFISVNYQWSIDELTDALQSSDLGSDPNFRIDMLPLHQGLNIFKKPIESLEHIIISVNANKNVFRTEAFMELPAIKRGSAIIFSSTKLIGERTRDVLIAEVVKTANFFLLTSFKVVSKYTSISEIFGVLWLDHVDTKQDASKKRRKVGTDIGERQMNTYGRTVYDFVSTMICAENESPSIYIKAGAKYSASKSTNLELIRSNLFEEEDEINIQDYLIHPSVTASLENFPRKNIKFSLIEIGLVISLFDVINNVRSEIEGDEYKIDNIRTADITKRLLWKHARYSELVVTSIIRWSENRDIVRKATGRKISVPFEADVWGRLMICELEQKIVSNIKTC